MFKYIFLFFFIYIGYQVIFKLVLPLFRATSVMRQQVNQMNEQKRQYESQVNPQQAQSNINTQPQPQQVREKEGEYIDFEEVS